MGARFGRYELLRPLGRGGMAEVFLARYVGPEGFEKRLVIKRVLPQLSDDRHLLRMFFEEARTQVSLSHGNLVSVFDFGRVANDYFIAMEHIDGADLASVVGRARTHEASLPPAVVAYIGVELCRALGYVHRRGFVHRDVTPRNVLISRDGEVKLSDFGVALALASEAEPGLRGTLAYVAPEQARGERVDGRADLFALGYVLGEAASGKRLRQGDSEEAWLAAARAGAPAAIDGPLAALIARATATAPEARFETADAMLAALEEQAAALNGGRDPSMRALAGMIPPPERDVADATAEAPANTGAPTRASGERRTAEPRTEELSGPAAGETYFRDSHSASFIDEVLGIAGGKPTTGRRQARRTWLPIALAAIGGIAGLGVLASRPTPPPPATAAIAPAPTAAPPPPLAEKPASIPPLASEAVPAPPIPRPAPAAHRSPAHPTLPQRTPPAPRVASSDKGALIIQCTPWCVPYIDGQPYGKDGRSFPLHVPVGPHVVEVRRLADRQERSVRVASGGEAQVLTFTFE